MGQTEGRRWTGQGDLQRLAGQRPWDGGRWDFPDSGTVTVMMVGWAGGRKRAVQMEGGWPDRQQVDGIGQCRLCSGTEVAGQGDRGWPGGGPGTESWRRTGLPGGGQCQVRRNMPMVGRAGEGDGGGPFRETEAGRAGRQNRAVQRDGSRPGWGLEVGQGA